jgi:hypothetical protein
MVKVGFFVGEFPFSIEKYITDEIDSLSSIGIQPFIFYERKCPLKKYSHFEIESDISIWKSLKSLNGLFEESNFLKALKKSAEIFDDESVFAMATKASMIVKNKKIEILNGYSPKFYNVAMITSWITNIPFGISILTPEHLSNTRETEIILKEASFVVVYSDRILKDLKELGFFDTDKVLRVFPGFTPLESSIKKSGKVCLVYYRRDLIEKILKIYPPEKILLVQEEKVFNIKGEIEKIEKSDLSNFIGNLELIVYSNLPPMDNMFRLENRLLRKALFYGIPVLIFGSFKEGNNIEKILKNFIRSEVNFESVLLKVIEDEKFRKKIISEGKEIASALFDLQRNANLLKGLFERTLIEKNENNSMDRWLKRGRKLPRKN